MASHYSDDVCVICYSAASSMLETEVKTGEGNLWWSSFNEVQHPAL